MRKNLWGIPIVLFFFFVTSHVVWAGEWEIAVIPKGPYVLAQVAQGSNRLDSPGGSKAFCYCNSPGHC